MRGRRRIRLKTITRAGWELLEEGRDLQGKYRMEICGPSGERLTFRATSRPRCFLQVDQVLRHGKRLFNGVE